ncbi:hypothetical protein AVEN_229683-1, partial [Araneus ventricosus]
VRHRHRLSVASLLSNDFRETHKWIELRSPAVERMTRNREIRSPESEGSFFLFLSMPDKGLQIGISKGLLV